MVLLQKLGVWLPPTPGLCHSPQRLPLKPLCVPSCNTHRAPSSARDEGRRVLSSEAHGHSGQAIPQPQPEPEETAVRTDGQFSHNFAGGAGLSLSPPQCVLSLPPRKLLMNATRGNFKVLLDARWMQAVA